MSEDIALHFRDAPWSDVEATLNSLAPQRPPKQTLPYRPLDGWLYPEGMNFVTLWRFTDYEKTYEPEDIETLHRLLGKPPSCSLVVNFRRQTRYDVCTIVEHLSVRLLTLFPGIADDLANDLWTLEEIKAEVVKSEGKFLDRYRID